MLNNFKLNRISLIKNLKYLLLAFILIAGCGKSELDIQKEKIRQEANELRMKIDSTQNAIDSARVSLDSLAYKLKKDSVGIDSMMKKINPLRK